MATAPTKNTFGKRAPDGAWEIPILGDIGFFGTNGEELIRELNAVKPEAVKFIIYSGGGAVYDAIAVAGFIREQGVTCYAEIYGVCASAATVFAALAGPKNTAIAPGSAFLVHMPYGGDQKLIDNATAFLVDLYVSAYGWTKAEASKHMQADEGRGIFWTAKEAKSLGVCSEIMDVSAVAARLNVNPTAMAEKKKTVKVKATLAQAWDTVKALASGAEIEVEVDLEEAVATQLTTKDEEIDALKKQIETLEAAKADEATQAEAITNAEKEATQAKADLSAAASKHEQDVKALTEAHAKAVKDLEAKIPAATRTIANNIDPKIGGDPSKVQLTADQAFAKQVFDQMTPVQLAQYEAAKKRQEKATTTKA